MEKGKLILTNSIIENNKKDYYTVKDYGAGVELRSGVAVIKNSKFFNNYAKYGGAIYVKGGSLNLYKNEFKNNTAYASKSDGSGGHNIYVEGNGEVFQETDKIPDEVIHKGKLYKTNGTFQINSNSDLSNAINIVKKIGYDEVTINFKKGATFTVSANLFQFEYCEKLIINGNGATVKVSNPKVRDEYHFVTVQAGHYLILKDMTLGGFNTAILNKGNMTVNNTIFDGNKIDYYTYEDRGGAIKNDGKAVSAIIVNCTFRNNYAKYGGAIYNRYSSINIFKI